MYNITETANLRAFGPGTRILTSEGVVDIETLQNQFFKVRCIYGGWSYARCRSSQKKRRLWSVTLNSGKIYYCDKLLDWPILGDDCNTHDESEVRVVNTINRVNVQRLSAGDRVPYIRLRTLTYPLQDIGGRYTDGFCMGMLYTSTGINMAHSPRCPVYTWEITKEQSSSGIVGILLDWIHSITSYNVSVVEQNGYIKISAQDEELNKYMSRMGIPPPTEKTFSEHTYGIPMTVWGRDEDLRKGFIDGIYSSAGHLDTATLMGCITSTQLTVVEDLRDLFGFYGVSSTVRSTSSEASNSGTSTTSHFLIFYGNNFSHTFSITDEKKRAAIDSVRGKKYGDIGSNTVIDCRESNRFGNVWGIETLGGKDMFVMSHCFAYG